MRRRLLLVTTLLVVVVLLAGGCTGQSARLPEEEEVPSEEKVEPVITESSRWFPDSVRWLSDEEKGKLIEIAMSSPKAVEWRQKESQYRTMIGWIALQPDPSGEGYSGYSKYEYEIVETGILVYPPGRMVLDPRDADIYPEVTIWFGEPDKWGVDVAIDLEEEKVVFEEDYPARGMPPIRPEDMN
ncbi:MAG: hypothetical protein Q8O55_10270 [Dehalococcoidales bacterium]|nr:hypothetical protein [Dehalococcoidales bacterium]